MGEEATTGKRKKKKRWIIVVVILLVIVMLVKCGSGSSEEDGTPVEAETEEPTEESTPEELEETADSSENQEAATEPTTDTADAAEEDVETYKASCQYVDFQYKDMLRYEDDYKGKDYCFYVKIVQVMDNGSYRAIFDEDNNDIVLRDKRTGDAVKILADDEVTAYARYVGTATMTRALTGTEEEVPCFEMYAADIVGVTDVVSEESKEHVHAGYETDKDGEEILAQMTGTYTDDNGNGMKVEIVSKTEYSATVTLSCDAYPEADYEFDDCWIADGVAELYVYDDDPENVEILWDEENQKLEISGCDMADYNGFYTKQ